VWKQPISARYNRIRFDVLSFSFLPILCCLRLGNTTTSAQGLEHRGLRSHLKLKRKEKNNKLSNSKTQKFILGSQELVKRENTIPITVIKHGLSASLAAPFNNIISLDDSVRSFKSDLDEDSQSAIKDRLHGQDTKKGSYRQPFSVRFRITLR